jgi:hypothetical protein
MDLFLQSGAAQVLHCGVGAFRAVVGDQNTRDFHGAFLSFPSHLFLFEQQVCPWISSSELAAQGEGNYAKKRAWAA